MSVFLLPIIQSVLPWWRVVKGYVAMEVTCNITDSKAGNNGPASSCRAQQCENNNWQRPRIPYNMKFPPISTTLIVTKDVPYDRTICLIPCSATSSARFAHNRQAEIGSKWWQAAIPLFIHSMYLRMWEKQLLYLQYHISHISPLHHPVTRSSDVSKRRHKTHLQPLSRGGSRDGL